MTPIEPLETPHTNQAALFFGGNGHCAARLERAAAALSRAADPAPATAVTRTGDACADATSLALVDVPYPGFEGRPAAASREEFLAAVAAFCDQREAEGSIVGTVATGIGGLIAVSLRARGSLRVPLILQAPVLWGLERRRMPALLRWRLVRKLLPALFSNRWFQRRFARRQFQRQVDPEWLGRFFAGYARCAAFGDLFAWFTPAFLRDLERQFAARPAALADIKIWWGGRDAVLDLQELAITERALGTHWPVVTFPDWGHYPMIDEPEEWADALRDALARPR